MHVQFLEREREKVTLLYDAHIKWHLLKTHVSLQICFFEWKRGGGAYYSTRRKKRSHSL